MPPTLVLIRHTQALHNVKPQDLGIHDPGLTDLGRQQAIELRSHLQMKLADKPVGLIITSPMRRTLQTCDIALDWLIKAGVRVEADALWQENYDWPSDTGTPEPELAKEYRHFDFTHLDPLWPDKTSEAASLYHCTRDAVLARGRAALKSVFRRPEQWIVVVSHSGFLRTGCTGRWFGNGDYRVFDFADQKEIDVDGGQPCQLVEHECTKETGGRGLSKADPVELGADLPLSMDTRPTKEQYLASRAAVNESGRDPGGSLAPSESG